MFLVVVVKKPLVDVSRRVEDALDSHFVVGFVNRVKNQVGPNGATRTPARGLPAAGNLVAFADFLVVWHGRPLVAWLA